MGFVDAIGNAIAKVKAKDAVKVLTVRTTAFPAAASSGSGASTEAAPAAETKCELLAIIVRKQENNRV